MGEVLLMKGLKAFLGFIGMGGSLAILIDQQGIIRDALKVNPALYNIISYLFVIFFIAYIYFYIRDKILNSKERNQVMKERELEMDRTREEIEDLRDNHNH